MAHGHGSISREARDTIDTWVSDFLDRPAARAACAPLGADASSVLSSFLEAACHGGAGPADVESSGVAHAILDHLALAGFPAAWRDAVPELVATFLGDLEDVGRLSGGRALAAQARACAPVYRERASGRGPDLTRPAPKIGRNDPCPCGSGKKYKRCCAT